MSAFQLKISIGSNFLALFKDLMAQVCLFCKIEKHFPNKTNWNAESFEVNKAYTLWKLDFLLACKYRLGDSMKQKGIANKA